MKWKKTISLSVVNRYRFNTILFIALLWTAVDTIVVLTLNTLPAPAGENKLKPLLIREIILFIISLGMGYLLVVYLKKIFRNFSLWTAYLIKSSILILAAFLINLLLYSVNSVSIFGIPLSSSFHRFYGHLFDFRWVFQKMSYWLLLSIITQLILEINEKYSPGVFVDIFFGKYIQPKVEKRIIMFIDLKDSTLIAEKLTSKQNFRFIREFIYQVSTALIENHGRIYQYVGDEIVVSWLYTRRNVKKCIHTASDIKTNLQRTSSHFKKRYGIMPQYRAGIHVGEVTVGEIGVIKKDLAMSGDPMNTAARIKAASTELGYDFVISKDFVEQAHLKEGQTESLGLVELKGKVNEVELFGLKI